VPLKDKEYSKQIAVPNKLIYNPLITFNHSLIMTKQIILKSRPTGKPITDNFKTRLIEVPEVADGEVRLAAHLFSVDPYMRGRMSDAKSYVEPYQVGEAIVGGLIAKVVESKSKELKVGDYVIGSLPWQEEMVVPAKGLQLLDEKTAPLSYYLGVLGMPGLTAYFGLLDIGKPQKGETVVVSGAAVPLELSSDKLPKYRVAEWSESLAMMSRKITC